MRTRVSVILFLLARLCCEAQSKWEYHSNINFGCNVNFLYGKGQSFPGVRIFAGYFISGVYNKGFMVNYGPSLAVYTKSLGANLNPLIGDIEVDFTNSFSLGWTWGDNLSYFKYFRTVATAPYYNVGTNRADAMLLSTNLIVNSHGRNQAVGSITGSFPGLTINYYNDGGTPLSYLPLSDQFDRWWTGGFGVYVHNRSSYNPVEFSFDQFTGYSPLLFELANVIGINLPVYDLQADSAHNRRLPPSYNTSSYNVKVYLSPGYAVEAGVVGSLRDSHGRVYGLQDIIHTVLGFSLHPNNDINRVYFGGTYNNFNNVKVQ